MKETPIYHTTKTSFIILTTVTGNPFQARYEPNTGTMGYGKTEEEAIGNLILANPKEAGVSIIRNPLDKPVKRKYKMRNRLPKN